MRSRLASPRAFALAALALLAVAPTAQAALRGLVSTAAGHPIEGARVYLEGSDAVATTGRTGEFSFAQASPPATLRLEHPRFHVTTLEVTVSDPQPLTITLEIKQEIYEEIVVSATREASAAVESVSVAVSSVSTLDRPAPVATVAELVEGVPGVAENGQGGLFQAYSVRGVAGQRVATLFAGVRIVTERRAGATASFVDPLLLDRAEVVRGPYSSAYGSGALGGVVQVLPRRFTAPTLTTGYASQGDEIYVLLGGAVGGWSLGLARRQAGDAGTPAGERLFSRYEQWSATASRRWSLSGDRTFELLLAPSLGRDIGKPNTRFPDRTTLYPEERHLVTRFALAAESWRLELSAHPNDLETENRQAGETSLIDNTSFDLGLNAQREIDLPAGFAGRVGLEWSGRHGVEASEETRDLATGRVERTKTLDGRQDELGLYGSARRALGRLHLELGGRITWMEQANRGAATTRDSAWSGFAGLILPLEGGFELALNLGTGLRFPALSERFFSGSTGRGEVVANAALDPERSLSADLGLRYYGQRVFVEGFVYRNEIDDYIERIDLEPGVRTFVNLTSGTIAGFELDGLLQVSDQLSLGWAAQRARGEDGAGEPLADIPAARLEASVRWTRGAWRASGRLEHRWAKRQVGSGEKETPSAELLSASLGYRFGPGLELFLTASNLLDETYFPSADELSSPAAGRALGIGLGWSR